jgi:hypothetical protein
MTKIYIYCLFDKFDNFLGVYSSLKAVHRDAISICNKGTSPVYMVYENTAHKCSLTSLRNVFKRVKCTTKFMESPTVLHA